MYLSKIFDLQKALLLIILISVASASCGDQKDFGVTPSLVKNDTNITISLPKKHPTGFAVRTPHGEWIYIVDKSENFYFFKDFSLRDSFAFYARDLRGIEFQDGKRVISNVFAEKGDYLFYFADNLETESENTFSLSYTIQYVP